MGKIEDARHATLDDVDVCGQALRRLHALQIKHGDTHKHNFLIHPRGIMPIDLDFAEQNATEEEMNDELKGWRNSSQICLGLVILSMARSAFISWYDSTCIVHTFVVYADMGSSEVWETEYLFRNTAEND